MVSTDKNFALVIGVADYQNVRKLPYVDDAKDVAALLMDASYCGYRAENVHVLEDAKATRSAILKCMAELSKQADDKSTVFIYFSGHGGRISRGANAGQFLLPVDTVYPNDEDLAQTAISGEQFTEALSTISAERLTFVLDCCHAGGIGEPRAVVAADRMEPGLSESYLDLLKEGKGRVVVAATRSSDPAWVRTGSRHSVFTEHLLAGLRGGARGDGGVIRIMDLYNYVQRKVVAEEPKQRPVFKAEIEENYPIALFRGGGTPELPPAAPFADKYRYDVFVSYCQRDPDKSWVRKMLVPRLKSAGLKVFVEYLDFSLGAPIVSEMERTVAESRYTVGVLSPLYLQSNFTDFENVLAQHLGLEESQRRFIGVLREQCKPRLGIRARYYLDMTDDDEFEAALARLIGQVRQSPDIDRIES